MIYRVRRFFWRLGRFFSRSEWMVKLLRLPGTESRVGERGLVLIQIDGLGHFDLEHALMRKKMPFLQGLIKKERYSKWVHYSGVPSNTPAVQGMLFYGVKACVPAFSFFERQSGKIVHLFEPESACSVEEALQKKGAPLLKGGSSYGNIFSGGAKECHFCSTTMGWGGLLKAANPFVLSLTLFLNAHIFIRAFFLGILEVFLAVLDGIRGIFLGKNFAKELYFVPVRVAVCIFLREAVAAAAKIDIARGVPIIHLNLAGYDEQAHHRGPHSEYSYWTLRGIDSAIASVWKAARHSPRRDYDVWVYSDHGQEDTEPYPVAQKRSIQEAVAAVFEEKILKDKWQMYAFAGSPHWRAGLLRRRRLTPPPPGKILKEETEEAPLRVRVAAMGPVGHIYSPILLDATEKEKMAKDLVSSAKIPLVLVSAESGEISAWTSEGRFVLPEDAPKILGAEHPFLNEVSEDLVELCRHPDSGTFIIFGWQKDKKSLSFAMEHGAHAGPGVLETSGFALLPRGLFSGSNAKKYLRTGDLRYAAARLLGRTDICPAENEVHVKGPPGEPCAVATAPRVLRLMTYNVHSCTGMDGRVSPARIAQVIAYHRPDIVALQELDRARKRTGGDHQAELIAKELAMTFEFQAALSVKEEHYGDAILSRFPMRPLHLGRLPGFSNWKYYEPRGALWVEIDVDGKKIHVVNAHLSYWHREGLIQANALLGPDWMGNPACQNPMILCGDFNALPRSPICNRISRNLRDVQLSVTGRQPFKTWWTFHPVGRIDHVFVGPQIKVLGVEVPKTYLERIASDHMPLVVDLQI